MTAPRARAATRALAVLVVLLGLLAMHGLASTHHAAAASSAPHAQADAAPAAEIEGAQHHVAAMSAAERTTVALASPGATCDQTCPGIGVLCVAVLTGAALALMLARRRRSSVLLLPPASPRAPASAPPVRHARGPDPVRELCVSRT